MVTRIAQERTSVALATIPTDLPCAGVDEAGRGPLAGPVAVAAVVFPPGGQFPSGLNDSKRLTAAQRQTLYPQILSAAIAWHVVLVAVEEIDQLNILQATLSGMRQVVRHVHPIARFACIDGNRVPSDLPCPSRAIIGGDQCHPAIMAASILAKVQRDHYMTVLDQHYPQYGFSQHKGYGTRAHREALRQHGPCPAHRRSFAPVRQCLTDWQNADLAKLK